MDNMIIAQNISFKYDDEGGEQVLRDITLNVRRGEFLALLGHNGSGKSTVAKHFNAILLPNGGKVYVNGLDTSNDELLTEIRTQVGMVFQNPDNQMVASVVEEDVAFGPENLGVANPELRERVDNALRAVGMYDHRRNAPHKLSGGQKQRIAIAGIIAMRPECIVLDESTAMLDPSGREEVMATVTRLCREEGITVVLITHYMEEAARADRVVVLSEGRILVEGTPQEVFSQVELLREHSLDVPQATELAWLLRREGIDIPDVLTAEQCAAEIEKLLKGCAPKDE